MSNSAKAVIFDGDDTLWETQIFYEEAKAQFYELMATQGFDRGATKAKLAEFDIQNVNRLGFAKHRFPLSMRQVYKYFCTKASRAIDSAVLKEISEVGYSVFCRKPLLMDGALEVLDQLRRRSYDCYLYTVGDPGVQREKLETLSIVDYFDAVYIRERKDESELQAIIKEQGLEVDKTWVVGNSLRSDINPALRLGLKCVWIRSLSWEYDHEPLLLRRVPQTDSLWKLLTLLEGDEVGRSVRLQI